MRVEINHQTKKKSWNNCSLFFKVTCKYHVSSYVLGIFWITFIARPRDPWKIYTTYSDFYVKSFLDSRSAKLTIWPHLEALNFDFYEFLHFLKDEIYHIRKIQSPVYSKNGIFRTLDHPKLISRKIWVTEKSWNFHTVECQLTNFEFRAKQNNK